jgi:hypothetical protein
MSRVLFADFVMSVSLHQGVVTETHLITREMLILWRTLNHTASPTITLRGLVVVVDYLGCISQGGWDMLRLIVLWDVLKGTGDYTTLLWHLCG